MHRPPQYPPSMPWIVAALLACCYILMKSPSGPWMRGSKSMQQASAAIQPKPWKPQPFMPVNPQIYSEIQQFLIYEALLLDHRCFDQWASLLSRDINYSVC